MTPGEETTTPVIGELTEQVTATADAQPASTKSQPVGREPRIISASSTSPPRVVVRIVAVGGSTASRNLPRDRE
jgi:hypothetical protein